MNRAIIRAALLSLFALASCDHSPSTPATAKPTASEVFKLRDECAKRGKEREQSENDNDPKGSASATTNYNPLKNRCYIRLYEVSALGQNVFLEDGQTRDWLAVQNISTAPGAAMPSKIGNRVVTSEEAGAFIKKQMQRDDGNEVETAP